MNGGRHFHEGGKTSPSSHSVPCLFPQVQPVNAGKTWSGVAEVDVDDPSVVVVVDSGSGPVKDETNVPGEDWVSEMPTATQVHGLTHDTDRRKLSPVK